jgi:hypothetical protein
MTYFEFELASEYWMIFDKTRQCIEVHIQAQDLAIFRVNRRSHGKIDCL